MEHFSIMGTIPLERSDDSGPHGNRKILWSAQMTLALMAIERCVYLPQHPLPEHNDIQACVACLELVWVLSAIAGNYHLVQLNMGHTWCI